MNSSKGRPLGVTILAGLEALVVSIPIADYLFVTSLGSRCNGFCGAVLLDSMLRVELLLFPSLVLLFLLLPVFPVVAYGLWTGKRWAWTTMVVVTVIWAIVTVRPLAGGDAIGAVGLIIQSVTLFYLLIPRVRAFFGRAPLAKPLRKPLQQPSPP